MKVTFVCGCKKERAPYDLNNGSGQDYLLPSTSFSEKPEPPCVVAAIDLTSLAWACRRRLAFTHR
jgi:hypothetical protein